MEEEIPGGEAAAVDTCAWRDRNATPGGCLPGQHKSLHSLCSLSPAWLLSCWVTLCLGFLTCRNGEDVKHLDRSHPGRRVCDQHHHPWCHVVM